MPSRYDRLTHDEFVRLLEARDRRDATRFGLVWEANEIERDRAVNADFVASAVTRMTSNKRGDTPPRAVRRRSRLDVLY